MPAAGTELFKLIRQGRLEWQAELGSEEVMRVRPGNRVEVYTADGEPVEAKMRARAPSENTKKRTTLVYVDVPASQGLWAGMFAHGSFDLGESPALTVPMEALVPSDGLHVCVPAQGRRSCGADRVTAGRQEGNRIEITPVGNAKLTEADRVVVEGAAFLTDDDLVKVAGAKE